MSSVFPIKNTNGFTLNEGLIALGIVSIVILIASAMLEQVFLTQKRVAIESDTSLFIDSLSAWIKSPRTQNIATLPVNLNPAHSCTGAFNGLNLPDEVNPNVWNGVNITIPISTGGGDWRYRGFGDHPADGSTSLAAGTLITDNLQIAPGDGLQARFRSLTHVVQTDNVIDKITTGVMLRRVMQIRLKLIKKISSTLTGATDDKAVRDVYLEFPVGVLGAVVQACLPEKSMADACRVQGTVLDPATGTCKPAATCEFSGRYIDYGCTTDNGSYPISMGTYPCNQFALLGNPAQAINEISGSQSCPAGSQVFFMGEAGPLPNSFTVSCGKKCSFTVTHTYWEKYYSCMRCN